MSESALPGLDDAWQAFARTRDHADYGAVAVRLALTGDPVQTGTHVASSDVEFGLSDRTSHLRAGTAQQAGGLLFEFGVVAKRNRTTGDMRFVGPFANGPGGGEFLYLSWREPGQEGWLMRIKIPLTTLAWESLVAADAAGQTFAPMRRAARRTPPTGSNGRRPDAAKSKCPA